MGNKDQKTLSVAVRTTIPQTSYKNNMFWKHHTENYDLNPLI